VRTCGEGFTDDGAENFLFFFVGREWIIRENPPLDTKEGGDSCLLDVRELFVEFVCEVEAHDG